MNRATVNKLLHPLLKRKGSFLVELKVTEKAQISVVIDNLKGITLSELAEINKDLEAALQREEKEFTLTVTSPGVGEPLQVPQQYEQNVGRRVKLITLRGEEHSGRMVSWDGENATLQWTEKEPKPVGKGKVKVNKEQSWALQDIGQLQVEIEF